jgi:hypothetical protein
MICCLSSEEDRMLIAESFVGDGGGAAHVNTVPGDEAGLARAGRPAVQGRG